MAKPKSPTYSGPSTPPGGGGAPGGGNPGGGGNKSSGGGAGGGGGGGISGAERRANNALSKAQRKASDKYKEQAKTLGLQIKALKLGLNGDFQDALRKRLANSTLTYKQADKTLVEGYKSRVGDLAGAAKDNEKSQGDQSYANLSNRSRERVSALTEATSHGAGESDVLRTQMQSLRSWDANQGEVSRSFFDTLRSTNSALGDLNADTKTARLNAESQKNNDRDQLYTQYYNQKSDAYTQLGNLRGQQAELYGLANEQVSSKKTRKLRKEATAGSGAAFKQAGKYATAVYKNPGNSAAIRNWKGEADFEGKANASIFENAATNIAPAKKPEGAKLRTWDS